MLKLSVLDQSTAISGRPHDESIRRTLKMAKTCEALGYSRFWVSEHHNHAAIVGSAPEVLMAAIAATTDSIRIGSAGVMLPHYSPLKVAEQFRVLDALAPGRIDMGLGRAAGSDGRTAYAMNPNGGGAADQFPESVHDLMTWVAGSQFEKQHPFAGVQAFPKSASSPDTWMLGSSDFGSSVAARFGIPFCFAHFITDGRGTRQALELYRENYRPSPRFPKPIATVCLWALAAETQRQARHLYATRAYNKVMRQHGEFGSLISPEDALAFNYTPSQRSYFDKLTEEAIIGDAPQVGAKLRKLAAAYAIDEVVILTWAFDPVVQQRSYELLAEEFKLATP